MNSNTASKRNKNRSNMSMSSNVHTGQKQMNRNMMRNTNGQISTNVNHHLHQTPQLTSTPPSSQNNTSKYSSSNSLNNFNLDDLGGGDINTNGVYKNGRLMHTVTSLIGNLVEVELTNGQHYEGIFKTFSPEFDLVLFSVAPILNNNIEKLSTLGTNVNLIHCLENNFEVIDKMVVKQKNMVKIKALNVELDYATAKKSCLTDSEIAKMDSKSKAGAPRELIPWDADDEEHRNCLESIEGNGLSNGSGWEAEDMLKYNAKKFNINSTFRDEMPEYTIQLQPRNDDDYRIRAAQAELIAREIEKDPNRQKRLAIENDLDEETRFSAVVANKRDDPSISSRGDTIHSSREERRDLIRNNSDGFRTQQSSRQARNNNRGGGSGTVSRNSADRDNWRNPNPAERRFNATQPSYNNTTATNYNAKSSNPPQVSGGYGQSPKYSGASVNTPNQYSSSASSAPKSSYSAVSARHIAPDPLSNENESKSYPNSNRGHSIKSYHGYQPNEDQNKRNAGNSQNQRELKQRSGSRIIENESAKPPASLQISASKPDTDSSMKAGSPPTPATPPTLANESTQPLLPGQQKQPHSPNRAKSDTNNNQQSTVNNARPSDDNESQPPVSIGKQADSNKKRETPTNQTTLAPSAEISKIEAGSKIETLPIPSNTNQISSPGAASVAPTQTVEPSLGTVSPSSTNSVAQSVDSSSTFKSSLNPNAKTFTPRVSPGIQSAAPQQFIPPNTTVVPNFSQYPQQHISTTPPSAQSMPSQFIQLQPHMTQQPHPHPHPHSQQAHSAQLRANPGYMQFSHYNIIAPPLMSGVAPQYIQMGPNGQPVFSGPVATGVPTQAGPNQVGGPNQQVPGGPMPAHHMVANTSVVSPAPNPAQQSQGPPRQYRSGKSSNLNHGSGNPNHQSQQYINQRQPHIDYSQQSQVANVTGQPIMAATVPQTPIAYSTASLHAAHHHHHQSHGQQPQNMTGAPMPPQAGPSPAMSYQPITYPNFQGRLNFQPPHAINLAAPMQTSIYDPATQTVQNIMICDCPPQMVPQQSIAPVVTSTNPNMQSSGPNIPSSASSNVPPNPSQISQGAPQQQVY